MRKTVLFLALVVVLTSQSLFAQVPSYVPTNGLVGYWPFNGNANDESGNGNNGTVNGATLTSDRFGNTNMAYEFNNTHISVNNLANSQFSLDFTISAWVYLDALSSNNNYPTFIEEENSGLVMQIEIWPLGTTPKYNCYFFSPNIPGLQAADGHVQTNTNYNNWHHVVLSNFNNINFLYLDGTLKATSISPSKLQGVQTGSYLKFGIGDFLPMENFVGKLDDIAIWNRALTQQEITNLYNSVSFNECLTMSINTGVLSTNPFTYTSSVSIYPNPANDQITIDCGNLANVSGWSIKITNMQGQEVFSQPMNTQQYVLPLNTWSGQGMYFVKIINAQNEVVNIKKIILH